MFQCIFNVFFALNDDLLCPYTNTYNISTTQQRVTRELAVPVVGKYLKAGLSNAIKGTQENAYIALFSVVSMAVTIFNQCFDSREIAFLGC